MKQTCIALALLASAFGPTTPARAHGTDHASLQAPLEDAGVAEDQLGVPAYLLAAVCGSRGQPGDQAFERRLQLVRLAQANRKGFDQVPPLLPDLGTRSFPVTTDNETAQRYFDQGLALTYAFNHPEALRSFRHAHRLDSGCAMCLWGQAYVLGPNINAPMDPDALAPAVRALKNARMAASRAGPKERALIDALTARYSEDPGADRASLNSAYAGAMAQVAAGFPEDPTLQSLYADALMNLSPWDYWEADGTSLKAPVQGLLGVLERALALDPEHPYAIHLYIHAVEASQAPERAEPYADRLAALMPGAGHLVHMPSHIYFRIGRFRDSIETNRAAVAADESYLQAVAPPEGMYPYSYYPHNVHFLLESARMAGDADTALAAAEKLPKVLSKEVSSAIPWVQLIDVAPYFAHAQFSAPEVTLALPDPGDELPYVKAMWHYARGVAHAAWKDLGSARAEAEAIDAIARGQDFSELVQGGVPAPQLLGLAGRVLAGRMAQARGDYPGAIEAFREASEIQEELPYLEPPYWYYPVAQSLGAVLLQQGRSVEAEQVFRTALERSPNNAWVLFGLREALRASGESSELAEVDRLLNAAWAGKRNGLKLSRL